LSIYRVVATSEEKHSLLFRHYQEDENDSFMISLYIDGRNEWKELGETVFGHEIAELKREFKTSYNPRLKERQVVDLSSLILMKPDGTEIKLLKNNLMQIVVYKAKLYDSVNRRFLYVVEGTKLGDLTVHNITGNEVLLQNQDGELFTLSGQ